VARYRAHVSNLVEEWERLSEAVADASAVELIPLRFALVRGHATSRGATRRFRPSRESATLRRGTRT